MKKTKLIVSIFTCICSVLVLCFGVYAAMLATFSMSGEIQYDVNNAYVEINTKIYKFNESSKYPNGFIDSITAQDVIMQIKDLTFDEIEERKAELDITDTEISIPKYSSGENIGVPLNSFNLKYSQETGQAFFIVINVKNLVLDFPLYAVVNSFTAPSYSWSVHTNGIGEVYSTQANKNIVVAFGLENLRINTISNASFNIAIQCGKSEGSKALQYTAQADYVDVTGFDASELEDNVLVIPSTHTELPVKNITASFSGATSITSVIFGENVISTPDMSEFENLTSVIFNGSNVESMAKFDGCTKLRSIIIPSSVTSLNLANCEKLTNVMFEDGFSMTSFAENTFEKCNFEIFRIPESVTTLLKNTFLNCSNLTNIQIHPNITKIESDVFSGTEWLSDLKYYKYGIATATNGTTKYLITVGYGMTEIDLTGVAVIAGSALQGVNFKTIYLPKTLVYIGSNAFYGITEKCTIYYPDADYNPVVEETAYENCNAVLKTYTA